MNEAILNRTIKAFNNRQFSEAVEQSAEGLAGSQGQDEAFWLGLHEAALGYDLIGRSQWAMAERRLVNSMQTLRNFGFRYENFEVTVALAGIRTAVEEIRAVRNRNRKVFDVSLLPQFRLAAKADL